MATEDAVSLPQVRRYADCHCLLPHAQVNRPADVSVASLGRKLLLDETDPKHRAQCGLQLVDVARGDVDRSLKLRRISERAQFAP